MRSLVVTTGTEKFIMETWLPSLCGKGNYIGDVLIIDIVGDAVNHTTKKSYILKPFCEETIKYLQSQKNIIYRKVRNIYPCIASDRIRAFYECLQPIKNEYDVIMTTDGNDIEFFKPIAPLLKMAETDVCAVKESVLNKAFEAAATRKLNFPNQIYESIKNERCINAGVIVGPTDKMLNLFEFMIKNADSYSSEFFSEQLSLNAWCYHLKNPIRDVGFQWNCLNITMGIDTTLEVQVELGNPQTFSPKITYPINSAYIQNVHVTDFNGKNYEVAIFHFHKNQIAICPEFISTKTFQEKKCKITCTFPAPMNFLSDKLYFDPPTANKATFYREQLKEKLPAGDLIGDVILCTEENMEQFFGFKQNLIDSIFFAKVVS